MVLADLSSREETDINLTENRLVTVKKVARDEETSELCLRKQLFDQVKQLR